MKKYGKRNEVLTFVLFAALVVSQRAFPDQSFDPYEPNNSMEEAFEIELVDGSWVSVGAEQYDFYDTDYYKFEGKRGDRISIRCEVTSTLDGVIAFMYGPSAEFVLFVDDNFATVDETITDFVLPMDCTCYIAQGSDGYLPWLLGLEKPSSRIGGPKDMGTYNLHVHVEPGIFIGKSLSGTVTDAGDGSPVSGTDVSIYYTTQTGNYCAVTDDNGFYEITDIASGGPFLAVLRRDGYHNAYIHPVELTEEETTVFNVTVDSYTGPKTVLLEWFTGTWCEYCPYGADIVMEMREKYDNLIVLTYHGGDELSLADAVGLSDKLGNYAVPEGTFDRMPYSVTNRRMVLRGEWGNAFREMETYKSPVKIELEKSYDSTTRTIDLDVSLNVLTDMEGSFRLNVIVKEDSLNYAQNIYESEEPLYPYYHLDVVRGMITRTTGEDIGRTSLSAGEVVSKTYSFPLPEYIVDTQCEVVVFVHEDLDNGVGPVLDAVECQLTESTGPATSGSVSGYIVDAVTGMGIASATVSVMPGGLSVTTDETGRFFIVPLTLGDAYMLFIEKDGYRSAEEGVAIESGETTLPDIPLETEPSVQKQILIEEFTGTWCQYCPDGTEVIRRIERDYGGAIVLTYHQNDAMSTDYGDDYIARMQVNSFPSAYIDRSLLYGYSSRLLSRTQWEDTFMLRSQYSPTFDIRPHCEYDPESGSVDLDIDIEALRNLDGAYLLNIVVTEDSLDYVQRWGHESVSPYYHYDVVREMITGVEGEPLNTGPIEDGDVIGRHYTIALDHGYVPEECNIVVFVHENLKDGFGPVQQSAKIPVVDSGDTAVETRPGAFRVSAPYPNPFNPSTTIDYELPEACRIELVVHDILGRTVAVLENGHRSAGTHQAVWNGRDSDGNPLSSGIYFFRLTAGDRTANGKLLYLK